MQRDPFYQEILEGLSKPLDPNLFEECAADVLRSEFPTLVPIRGGADAGMDGAVADGEGPAYPLVSTTSKDVIRNLTRNLESYVAEGQTRRKVIVATTTLLTSRKRRNLERRAEELGFQLIQAYDRAAMADRLYSDPRWCKELLNLSGNPPPLSPRPPTKRPLLDLPLIGRSADLEWLRGIREDSVLVGEPGSGKSFLLYTLADQGWGMFITTDDIGQIANAIRTQQPRVIILDDAHESPQLLVRLRHFREETAASFWIVASTWPGDVTHIQASLAAGSKNTRNLERLTRDNIAEIVNHCGIRRPDRLIQEIVNQAEGFPGLAVTLAQLCLRESIHDVTLGTALSRDVMATLGPLVGNAATELTAHFALGGSAGMSIDMVSAATGESPIQVRSQVIRLAAGGIIHEVRKTSAEGTHLAVRPRALREALVRDVFFNSPAPLSPKSLIKAAPSTLSVAETLVGAKHRGAQVSSEVLQDLIRDSVGTQSAHTEHKVRLLGDYVLLGKPDARWALDAFPGFASAAAVQFLHVIPEEAIPGLLDMAVGDRRPLHQHPRHPLRKLQDWIKNGAPGTGIGPRRREILIDASVKWFRNGGNQETSVQSLMLSIFPGFEITAAVPGSGQAIKWVIGLLEPFELRAVASSWSKITTVLHDLDEIPWEYVVNSVNDWIFPQRCAGSAGLSSDAESFMTSAAREMVRSLADFCLNHAAAKQWIVETAQQLELSVGIEPDDLFAALYPKPYFASDREQEGQRRRAKVDRLASSLVALDPATVAHQIAKLEADRQRLDQPRARMHDVLASKLSRLADNPHSWTIAFINSGAPTDVIAPFFQTLAETNTNHWKDAVKRCLENKALRRLALVSILTHPSPPSDLLHMAVNSEDLAAIDINILVARGNVPEGSVSLLLQSEVPGVASEAAVGIWHHVKSNGDELQEPLKSTWGRVILDYKGEDYWLEGVLRENPDLAYRWLSARVNESHAMFRHWEYEDSLNAATTNLSTAQRKTLIAMFPEDTLAVELAEQIVGDDLETYQALLDRPAIQQLHLAPLATWAEDTWAGKAATVRQSGYSSEAIIEATISPSNRVSVIVGRASAHWQAWLERFDTLLQHENSTIREVAALGKQIAASQRDHAVEHERREDIFGWE